MIKLAERYCTRLYASDVGPGETTESASLARNVPPTTKEVEKALKGMEREKHAGDDGITVERLKEGSYI